MARISMNTLIARLRGFASASADELTINGTAYFTDDQLQAVLESHSDYHNRVAVYPIGEYTNGEMLYTRYPLPYFLIWAEGAGDGSAWRLTDGTGANAPTHTFNMEARQIIFSSPTDGRTYYLSATVYDLHAAAADVWRQKMAHASQRVSFSVDGQAVSASDYHAHCARMVAYYDGLAGAKLVTRIRTDEVGR